MEIAIFNSFSFHYEMYGYLLHWATKRNNFEVTIYDRKDNKDLGYLSFYRKHFTFHHKKIDKFIDQAWRFSIVFLTTDGDPKFNKRYITNMYRLKETTIRIIHRPLNLLPIISKFLALRDYCNNLYALHCYPICSSKKQEDTVISIFVGNGGQIDDDQLLTLSQQENVILYFVGRKNNNHYQNLCGSRHFYLSNLDTEEITNLMIKCCYLFYGIKKDHEFNSTAVSGYLSLALSCGTPIICTEYTRSLLKYQGCYTYQNKIEELLPLTIPDNQRTLAEREIQMNLFDQAIISYFPSHFRERESFECDNILHFVDDPIYLESWKRWYPDFKFRFHLSIKDLQEEQSGILVKKNNLFCQYRLSKNDIENLPFNDNNSNLRVIDENNNSVFRVQAVENFDLSATVVIIFLLLIVVIFIGKKIK